MKKVLVTGGAGYCGSVLVPDLLNNNYKVRVLDTLYFGNPFSKNNSSHLEVIKGDIRDLDILNKFLKSEIGKKPHISICIHRMDII